MRRLRVLAVVSFIGSVIFGAYRPLKADSCTQTGPQSFTCVVDCSDDPYWDCSQVCNPYPAIGSSMGEQNGDGTCELYCNCDFD